MMLNLVFLFLAFRASLCMQFLKLKGLICSFSTIQSFSFLAPCLISRLVYYKKKGGLQLWKSLLVSCVFVWLHSFFGCFIFWCLCIYNVCPLLCSGACWGWPLYAAAKFIFNLFFCSFVLKTFVIIYLTLSSFLTCGCFCCSCTNLLCAFSCNTGLPVYKVWRVVGNILRPWWCNSCRARPCARVTQAAWECI